MLRLLRRAINICIVLLSTRRRSNSGPEYVSQETHGGRDRMRERGMCEDKASYRANANMTSSYTLARRVNRICLRLNVNEIVALFVISSLIFIADEVIFIQAGRDEGS